MHSKTGMQKRETCMQHTGQDFTKLIQIASCLVRITLLHLEESQIDNREGTLNTAPAVHFLTFYSTLPKKHMASVFRGSTGFPNKI